MTVLSSLFKKRKMFELLVRTVLVFPLFWYCFPVSIAFAQITPDDSLGDESSTLTQDAEVKEQLVDLIKGGAERGNNLFHSFSEFNISEGAKVYFDNPEGVANILTRVTGNNISQILGTLGVNGSANLFMLNPNGIIFGEGARLDVAGSFLATTADRFVFENGFDYSASNPTAPPLLTVNLPIGLQFGNKAEAIVNRSITVDSEDFPVGLQLHHEQNLTLVGGDILLEGGKITNSFGRVELASVAPNSTVNLLADAHSWQLNFDRTVGFRDIILSQSAVINTTGSGGGDITLRGKRVILKDGSDIFAPTLSENNGGTIKINASESLELIGGQLDDRLFAVLDASTEGTGSAGNIEIATNSLRLVNGGIIRMRIYDEGNGGNINIKANEIELSGLTADGIDPSNIFSVVEEGAKGNGGNVNIEANRLRLEDGAQIGLATRGEGNAGNVNLLVTDSIDIAGILENQAPDGSVQIFSSGLFAGVESDATGSGGNLTIETGSLRLTDGARVSASTFGQGDAGDLSVIARDIEVNGIVIDDIGSFNGLLANVEAGATGAGGNLNITTDRLRILNGGQVSASSFGNGNAGNVRVTAKSIELSGTSSDGKYLSSLEAASTTPFNAGFLNINTENLSIRDGAQVSVSNRDFQGDAGNLSIKADRINLSNGATLSANVNTGDRGNIDLRANNIQLRGGSQINTNATGMSVGGNISIASDNLVLLEKSSIATNAMKNFGGRINIDTVGLFRSPDSIISAASELGSSFSGIVEINSLEIDPQSALVDLPEATVEPEPQVVTSCSTQRDYSLVVSGRGGIPENPVQTLGNSTVWSDLRLFPSDGVARPDNRDGSEKLKTEAKTRNFSDYSAPIEAQQWQRNDRGNLELIAMKDSQPWQTTPNCFQLEQNRR
jgi:filamentous hemagglutinin family protein